MPLVAASAFGEYRLKSLGYAVAPVATMRIPCGPAVVPPPLEVPLPPPLLLPPQAASVPAASSAAPAAIDRTRQGLADIAVSLFLMPWSPYGRVMAVACAGVPRPGHGRYGRGQASRRGCRYLTRA